MPYPQAKAISLIVLFVSASILFALSVRDNLPIFALLCAIFCSALRSFISKIRYLTLELVFLKEPQINTEVYRHAQEESIPITGTMIDPIIEGVNLFLQNLRREQIKVAFDQAEKEVLDNRQRTKEGIETARLNGKQIGRPRGAQITVKKKNQALKVIRKYSRAFNGSLSDAETMKLVGISRGTFYKYKKELLNQ